MTTIITTARHQQRYCPQCHNLIYGGYCECDDGLCDEPSCLRPAIYRIYVADVLRIGLDHVMSCQEHVAYYYACMPTKGWEHVGQ